MTRGILENFDDNFADGKAADVWDIFIGKMEVRMGNYKEALCKLLRKSGVKRILDLACGTGVDSIMLLEEGFEVVSIDASDKMLKYAWKTRWDRRKEPGFDNWEILEANWLTLLDDLGEHLKEGFDAAICVGSSFAYMVDPEGMRVALKNFKNCLKHGGILIVDHRNYDEYIEGGLDTSRSIYYHIEGKTEIKSQLVTKNGETQYMQYDYTIEPLTNGHLSCGNGKRPVRTDFTFRMFPHRLRNFSEMIKECFDEDSKHIVYGDYKPLNDDFSPGYYIHTITRGS